MMSTRKLDEDGAMAAPAMSAGSGHVAGIGVGPQGEPGVDMTVRRKKWKKEKTGTVGRKIIESQKPVNPSIWQQAQLAAKEYFPNHPTPESTKFAIAWYLAHGGLVASNVAKNESLDEDLRDWFGTGGEGGVGGGGWDRYNTRGERIGKCGGAEDRGGAGEGKPKCLSKEKAAQLRAKGGKQAIANAVKRKKAQDPVTNRKGTGNTPRPVSNRIGEQALAEKNIPTNASLWSRAKAEAKKRFDVYPSAYSNGWAAKWYKARGGAWKTAPKESNTPQDREWGTSSLTDIYRRDTPGQLKESLALLTELAQSYATPPSCHQCGARLALREAKHGYGVCDACVRGFTDDCGCATPITEAHAPLEEAEYQGRKVTLGKPVRTPGGPKKFSVYVKNDKGNVVKVNFGDPNLSIKRDDPKRRKAFLSRHNCDQPGPKWKAKYWSCKWGWGTTPISDKLK